MAERKETDFVPGKSVLAAIERVSGPQSRIVLREPPSDASSILRVHALEGEETVADDTRYEVCGEIARGGVGVIFKSRDRDLGREVALKVLRTNHRESRDVTQRFIEEAQIAGQLQHPGIVPVYGLGLQPDGRPFFAMKLVKGRTLSALLDDRRRPADDRRRFLSIFEQICQTMAYAHARGVIHRDLKPANIMVGAFGEVQIMDWGFAKVLGRDRAPDAAADHAAIATVRSGDDAHNSIAGSVLGTPSYMPPEQALGVVEEVDERADVFALGSILCEILTARAAYDAQGKEALLMAAQGLLSDALDRLGACDADEELVALARRCLAPQREARPRDAGAVARAITEYLAGVEERARQAELEAAEARAREQRQQEQAEWAHASRKRSRLLATTLLVAVLVSGGGYLWVDAQNRSNAAQAADAIERARNNAGFHRKSGHWAQAVSAAEHALQLARAADADEETIARVRDELAALRDRQRRADEAALEAEADLHVVKRLEEIGAWITGQSLLLRHGYDPRRTDREYAEAFLSYGIDIEKLPPGDAAARIRESRIAVQLAAALDDWTWLRRVALEEAPVRWGLLLDIARKADQDEWRNQLREAMHREDRAALRDLASTARVEALPPRTVALLGRALVEAWDPKTAVDFLQRAHRLHPDNVRLNHYLALAYQKLDPPRRDEVARIRTALVALRPRSPDLWQQLGDALLSARDDEGAVRSYRRAIDLRPNHALAHLRLGYALGLKGDYDGAVRLHADLPGARKRSVQFQLGLGLGLQRRALDFEDAAETRRELGKADIAFRTALRDDPKSAPLHVYWGAQLRLEGSLDEAIEVLRQAIRLDAELLGAYEHLAAAHRDKRDYDEAIITLKDAIRIKPTLPGYLALADTYDRKGDLDGTIAATRKAVELAPNFPGIAFELGRLLMRKGDAASAVAAFRDAIRTRPEHSMAFNNIAWLLATTDDPGTRNVGEALIFARKAVEMEPKARSHWNTLGVALYRNGKHEEAIKALERSASMPGGPDAYDFLFLAMAHARLKLETHARRWYSKALLEVERRAGDATLQRIAAEAAELIR